VEFDFHARLLLFPHTKDFVAGLPPFGEALRAGQAVGDCGGVGLRELAVFFSEVRNLERVLFACFDHAVLALRQRNLKIPVGIAREFEHDRAGQRVRWTGTHVQLIVGERPRPAHRFEDFFGRVCAAAVLVNFINRAGDRYAARRIRFTFVRVGQSRRGGRTGPRVRGRRR